MKLLIAKGFVIPFSSGVCVIRDWKVNNYIQSDRYTPTLYAEEKRHLLCRKNGQYDYSDTPCIQNVSDADTQDRKGKVRKERCRSSKADKPPRASRFTPPTVDEVHAYCAERKNGVDAERFVDFYESKGWLVGKSKMKDWRAAVRSWERADAQQAPDKNRIRTTEEYRKEADFFG